MIQIERHSALLVLEVVNSVDTYFIGIVDMQVECYCQSKVKSLPNSSSPIETYK
jgi:hypothetical protein